MHKKSERFLFLHFYRPPGDHVCKWNRKASEKVTAFENQVIMSNSGSCYETLVTTPLPLLGSHDNNNDDDDDYNEDDDLHVIQSN